MKRIHIGFSLFALALMPAFGLMALPLTQLEPPTLRFCRQMHSLNEKRPWLNPARATLRS